MTKRRPAFDPRQIAFSFEGDAQSDDGALAGFDKVVASAVSQILKTDRRSRFEVAGGLSALLDEEVSKAMLDAYSAEAKDTHNISVHRFLGLIAETQRYDVLDRLCQSIGCKVLVGEEILTAELGHVERQIERLQERRKVLKRTAPEIGGRKR